MKRAFCIIISLLMLMAFPACNEEDTTSESSVDLEYYANLGQIPECKYLLGTDVETLTQELSEYAESEEGSESLYDVTEGEETVCITNGIYNFYYDKDSKEEGINYIVSFEKAYGFNIGEIIVSVKDAIGSTKYTEEEINDENAFFLFAPVEGSVLKCEFENNTIMFVFENNALCATAIYSNT